MITIVLAGVIALLGTLIGTRLAISVLVSKGYGQLIRDDGPTSHHVKRGTPTMGGIVIVLAVLVAYAAAHLITWTPPRASGVLLLFLTAGLGLVGFLDDWIKISKQRSLGLRSGAKLTGQVAIGLAFAILSFQFPNERSGPGFYESLGGITPASPALSFLRDIPFLVMPIGVAVLWILLLIAAASNGMNLTDGVDGLAAGASVMVFGAYSLVNIWQYNQSCANVGVAGPTCYEVRDPHDLAVVAVAIAGACFGFLWWNCQPAKIFMGDTGSLALGGAMAAMAIYTRTELLLLLIGGLFVINTLSVILQVSYFRLTGGKRLFPMAPLHHTFELKGWAESTVVIRFWIIAGIFVAVGLALFYAEWVSGL
ncbi:MAG TPA: phospho-N-acetylmuramoyl-pentapeptide-transferase [Candidatus Avipropionibacterium avicola]|uniref:Phospho-N-acetylmuramoyl-pentapeptide-transferase n=1 Tax=Candidatus Avipropionibacterium avicola TaxID=2840701 RepID=A0A9D1KLI8_9ACTN|nr:phospho-N-acetylmuramoyl-pentapeptide-transferase [Candidatus Avipropionibacterium avicola]